MVLHMVMVSIPRLFYVVVRASFGPEAGLGISVACSPVQLNLHHDWLLFSQYTLAESFQQVMVAANLTLTQ